MLTEPTGAQREAFDLIGVATPLALMKPEQNPASPAKRQVKPGNAHRTGGNSGLTDERFLRAHYAELVSLRVGKDRPGLAARLPDVHPACPEREQAVNLLIAVCGAAGEVKVHAVLDGLGIGDRHEAHADRGILVSSDDDLVLALGENLPAKRLGPEPGQVGKVVSVNDDVMESDGHVQSMRGTLGCIA
jgi:hypothetical protein